MGPTEQSERASWSLGGQEVDQPTVLVDCADPPPGPAAPHPASHRPRRPGCLEFRLNVRQVDTSHTWISTVTYFLLLSIEAIALAEKGLPREFT